MLLRLLKHSETPRGGDERDERDRDDDTGDTGDKDIGVGDKDTEPN
jgi:hypothetical protein